MSIQEKIYNLRRDYMIKNQKMPSENLKLAISVFDYQTLEAEESCLFSPRYFNDGKLYYQGLQLVRSSDLNEGEMGIIN